MNIFLTKLKKNFHLLTILYWKLIQGDNTFRLNYHLDKNSLVFDVGGYHGDWTAQIYNKYQCRIFIFEPVAEYFINIIVRFKNIKKISFFNFGLSGKNQNINLHQAGNATSAYGSNSKLVRVKLNNINYILQKYQIHKIDLIKINIEGGEYDLLDYLIKSNLIKKFINIQIQFHQNIPYFENRYQKIRENLIKTHHLTYRFPFVWENWVICPNTNG